MIVHVVRGSGDSAVSEQVDGNLLFEGGAAQEGVLATFEFGGREVTGRVVRVVDADDANSAGDQSVIEIELIDERIQDASGETARASLPPGGDTDTVI